MTRIPCRSCALWPCICGEFDTLPSGRGGSGQIRLSPNVALKGAFDAGQGGGDAVTPALSPAVAYPFHDTLNTPGAK